ncbi:unnamed protein product [Clonostachys byssicola]|uniref:Uncharacterized protein n=1 Tax=Clonostachys byssicola TaxID=160290 RepID=A0A9N9UJ83_9HYPO|nr:unnamed protein product [Clonostachys byssicola]
MPRICAPVSKQLSRSVSSSVTAAARTAGHKNAGAVLMPKYAELLGKNEQSDSTRGITTTHRPTPQPSIANRNRPLMQTFSRSVSASISKPESNLGTTVLPSWDALYSRPSQADATPMVPIVPDNYGVVNVVVDAPVSAPEVTIVAVDPDRVSASSPFFEVTGLDGVDLKFAHQPEPTRETAQEDAPSQGMITDIWKGVVDDILGRGQQKKLA